MSDKDLLSRIQQRDFKAFEEVVVRYQSMVTNLCFNMTGIREDAEDLAQEVFIKVWEKAEKFRGDSSLQTWIYRIAINTSLNSNRKRKFQSLIKPLESIFESIGGSEDPQKKLESKETQNLVQQAILSLPENQQIALTLRTYKEHSYAEISDIMDISVSSVESLIFRAKRNLRKKLTKSYFS